MKNNEFRIHKEEYVNKTFRMKKELVERLSTAAQTEGVSVNEFVCQCCEFSLDNLVHNEDGGK